MNPVVFVGLAIAAVGWVLLVFAAPESAGFGLERRSVVNLHMLFIGSTLVLTGLAIAVLGAIHEVGQALRERTSPGEIGDVPAADLVARGPQPTDASVTRGQLAGREYKRHPDGAVEVLTMVGWKHFPSLKAAKDFLGVT
jgi:hypothetical protein